MHRKPHHLLLKTYTSVLFLLLLIPPVNAFGEENPGVPHKKVNLLTIGNSFADNSLKYLDEIVQSEGNSIQIFRANLGGATLERHAGHLQQFLTDPNNPEGKPYKTSKNTETTVSLIEALQSEKWDFVTIQQASFKSFIWETYEPFASQLIEAIQKYAPGARIMIHQTWAYRVDDPWFTTERQASLPQSQEVMYNALLACYSRLSRNHGLPFIPVGMAFQITRVMPDWEFKYPDPHFDYNRPEKDQIPFQPNSLNVGWRWGTNWSTGAIEFGMDGHHANQNGEYLGSCVFYEVLFGESLDKPSAWHPDEISREKAASLRKVAHTAVLLNPFKAPSAELSFRD